MSEYKSIISNYEKLLREYNPQESLESAGFWLSEMDITTYDFPFIHTLLSDSFSDWQKLSSSLPMMKNSMWALFQFDGSFIAGNSVISDYCKFEGRVLLDRCLSTKTEIIVPWNVERNSIIEQNLVCLFPLFTRQHGDLYAIMVCVLPQNKFESCGKEAISMMPVLFQSSFYKRFEYIFVDDMVNVQKIVNDEASRRAVLYQIVQRMQDRMGVDMLLTEMLDSIAILCPQATLQVFMSQDHQSDNPQVKPLILHARTDDVSVRTFMNGRLTIQETKQENGQDKKEIGFPLGGKQGVYGVLHLIIDKNSFREQDLQFISTIVDTAGTLFENAKLYEQSNLLIRELRLINELTQRVNQSLRLSEIYRFSNEELLNIFKADYCCILQFNSTLNGLEVVSCNLPAISKDVFEKDYGFGGLVFGKGEPIILSDYTVKMSISSIFMEKSGSQSLIATPLIVKGEVTGAILLAHQKSHFFTYNDYKLLQTLSNHIGISVSNALLHAEVKRMANRDMLTNLYARHYLDEIIHKKQKRDYCGSLIVVDIDKFKQVNDTHGHQKGDKVLKKVSEIIKTTIRKGDIAARWGGEELAIYLPQLGVKQATFVAERIRILVEKETDPPVTVSCGISEWNWMDDQVSVDSLFYLADMALYRAKNNGRNQIQIEDRNIS
jgi:diguanylate cyclase (GGDEF)-like protein